MDSQLGNLNAELRKELEELRNELEEIKQRLELAPKDGEDELAEIKASLLKTLEEALSTAVNKAKQPLEKAGEIARAAVGASKSAVEIGTQKVEEKPLLGLLTAFGLGLLVARTLDRK